MALAAGLKIKMGFIMTHCVPNTIIYLGFVVHSFRYIVTLMKKERDLKSHALKFPTSSIFMHERESPPT